MMWDRIYGLEVKDILDFRYICLNYNLKPEQELKRIVKNMQNPQSKDSPVSHLLPNEKDYLQERAEREQNQWFKDQPEMLEPTVGRKNDEGKRQWHLLPIEGTEAMVEVMEFGAKKYGDYNWYLGMDWLRLFNAVNRHLWAWFKGEENDPESGLPHISHASCCILMLGSLIILNKGKDDRPNG